MINGKSLLKQVVTCLVALFLLLFVLQGPTQAKSRPRRNRATNTAAIEEDKLPWAGTPWLIGIILTGGVVAVSLKSAKRTHLD